MCYSVLGLSARVWLGFVYTFPKPWALVCFLEGVLSGLVTPEVSLVTNLHVKAAPECNTEFQKLH